jgi:hypothetical protein
VRAAVTYCGQVKVLERVGIELDLDDEHLSGRLVPILAVAVVGDAQDHVGAILGRIEIGELGRGDLDVGVRGQPEAEIEAEAKPGAEPEAKPGAERPRQQHGRQPRALAKQQHQGFVQGGRHDGPPRYTLPVTPGRSGQVRRPAKRARHAAAVGTRVCIGQPTCCPSSPGEAPHRIPEGDPGLFVAWEALAMARRGYSLPRIPCRMD